MGSSLLRQRLGELRRRLLLIAGTAGAVWAVSAAVVVLLGWAWLDLLWELSPAARVAAWWCALALAVAVLTAAVIAARSKSRQEALARRLDRVAASGGQVLSGLELSIGPSAASPATQGLAMLAVDQAARVAAGTRTGEVIPARPLGVSLGVFSGLAAVIVLPGLLLQDLAATQWQRFVDPYGDTPPFARVKFEVRPGDARVVYGSGLDVSVTTSGAPVERVELVLATPAAGEEALPMFSASGEAWQATLTDLRQPAVYFIRAGSARSRRYRIEIATAPQIEQVRFVVQPPAYTNQSAYEGPLPGDGLAGLPGTDVRITASSNRPLASGRLLLTAGGQRSEIAMQPMGAGARQVAGRFAIRAAGKFELTVTDVDGQRSPETFAGTIRLLEDQRPLVRILEPAPMSLATPEVSVPVSVSAEDDYGISRLQLFRSLNDSRPLPMNLPLAASAPRRADPGLQLPLAAYGLVPGDVIKLFARVEDNDPAGAKGSESSVVTLQIVSQEDFERMLQTRYNLEMLMSKYREAQRRIDALREQAEGLKKKLKSGDKQAAAAAAAELQQLEQRIRDEAQALRQSAAKPLPYDVDQKFSRHLSRLADSLDKAAGRLEQLRSKTPPSTSQGLDECLEQLAGADRDLQQESVEPLEHLELVFPLVADQARFVELYRRQRDLAERAAALRGSDGEDSPAAKVRMRDLESEQRQLRDDLDELLNDIDEHVARLPERPEFAELRSTAEDFVAKLRASDAAVTMAEAEAALAEFAGTKAHARAVAAADILERFLAKCQGMNGAAGQCLKFSPGLSAALGNTLSQLLADMGLGSGADGLGQGRGGYSARRGSSESVGLYGSAFGMESQPAGRRGGAGAGGRHGSGGAGGQQRPEAVSAAAEPAAAGAAASEAPAQYRQRVSEYFRRLVEELNRP